MSPTFSFAEITTKSVFLIAARHCTSPTSLFAQITGRKIKTREFPRVSMHEKIIRRLFGYLLQHSTLAGADQLLNIVFFYSFFVLCLHASRRLLWKRIRILALWTIWNQGNQQSYGTIYVLLISCCRMVEFQRSFPPAEPLNFSPCSPPLQSRRVSIGWSISCSDHPRHVQYQVNSESCLIDMIHNFRNACKKRRRWWYIFAWYQRHVHIATNLLLGYRAAGRASFCGDTNGNGTDPFCYPYIRVVLTTSATTSPITTGLQVELKRRTVLLHALDKLIDFEPDILTSRSCTKKLISYSALYPLLTCQRNEIVSYTPYSSPLFLSCASR